MNNRTELTLKLVLRAREMSDDDPEKEKLERQIMFMQGFLCLDYQEDDRDCHPPHDDSEDAEIDDIYLRPSTVDMRNCPLLQQTINVRKGA